MARGIRTHPDKIAAMRRAQLRRLKSARYGSLPNNEGGRNLLKAMLACGLTGPEAFEVAKWITDDKLDEMICEVDSVRWNSPTLGRLVSLTYAEHQKLDMRLFRPIDISVREFEAQKKERRRERNRTRRRNQREERRIMRKVSVDLDLREESLFLLLDAQWVTIAALAKQVKGGRAWNACDGLPIVGASLQVIIRRVLDGLELIGLIESDYQIIRNGLRTRFVRRAVASARKRNLQRKHVNKRKHANKIPISNSKSARKPGVSRDLKKSPHSARKTGSPTYLNTRGDSVGSVAVLLPFPSLKMRPERPERTARSASHVSQVSPSRDPTIHTDAAPSELKGRVL